jgi:hypothetical protein
MEQAIATAPAPPRRDSGEAGIRKVVRTAWRNRGTVALGVAGLILIAASITMMALTAPHLSAKAGAVDIASTSRRVAEQAVQDQGAHEGVIIYVLGTAEQSRQGDLAVHGERLGHREVEQVPRDVSEPPLAHKPIKQWPDSIIQRTHQSVEICQSR